MTIQERIIEYLRQHPNGADDDEITTALELKHRQQANDRGRKLSKAGIIKRFPIDGKLRNILNDALLQKGNYPNEEGHGEVINSYWHWEGNVQNKVVDYLKVEGYEIDRTANTTTRERGKDIEAAMANVKLWVTVKGYPKGTPRTHPTTQAGHWFKGALYDVIAWRGENPKAKIALALPDFPRYRKLVKKVEWLMAPANFSIFWVSDNGGVKEENPLNMTHNR